MSDTTRGVPFAGSVADAVKNFRVHDTSSKRNLHKMPSEHRNRDGGSEEATVEVESECVITGDWSRVQQLFENLFRNAIEHGGADVTIRVRALADERGCISKTMDRVFPRVRETRCSTTDFRLPRREPDSG